jgi:uncharacterized protein (TIGR03435 family)
MARRIALTLRIAAGFLLIGMATAQVASDVRFEVASVKLATTDRDQTSSFGGGPGTSDPSRITCLRQDLSRLIYFAYGLDYDQVSGPEWLGTELYTIVANVPSGATPEQVPIMWRNLLKERFHFEAHLIQKEFTVYELSVARNGPRMQKAGTRSVTTNPDFPEPRNGLNWAMLKIPPRTVRMTFRNFSVDDLINNIKFAFGYQVRGNDVVVGRIKNRTGLEGRYDFTLEFAGSRGLGGAFPPPLPEGQRDTAPFLIDALGEQLGLDLREAKARLDVLVVDHADRVPVRN